MNRIRLKIEVSNDAAASVLRTAESMRKLGTSEKVVLAMVAAKIELVVSDSIQLEQETP